MPGPLPRPRRHPVLAPDDAFWALALHCILDKGVVAERHARRLQELVDQAQDDGPMGAFIASVLPADWDPARSGPSVRAGGWTDLVGLQGGILLRLWRRDPSGAIRRIVVRAFARRRVRPPAAPAVGRYGRAARPGRRGQDDAGGGDRGRLRSPGAQDLHGHVGAVRGGRQDRIPGLTILARPWAAAAKSLVAEYHRAHGRLVVFDRYTYDALIPPRGRLASLKRPYFWILAHAAPAPQLVVVLDAPGELLFARKGESDPVRLEEDRLAFRALGARLGGVTIVDAAQPADAIRVEVTDLIWRRYLAGAGGHGPAMSAATVDLLMDVRAGVRPALARGRTRLTRRRALMDRAAMLPPVLRGLDAAGLLPDAVLAPGQPRWSHTGIVIVPFGRPGEPAELIVKFADTEEALTALRAQRSRLDHLNADPRVAGWTVPVPRVVSEGAIGGRAYFVETAVPGVPASRLVRDEQVRRRLLPVAAGVIAELHARTATATRVDDAILDRWIDGPAEVMARILERWRATGPDSRAVLDALRRELRAGLLGDDASAGWIHGDFWPGNILVDPGGTRITGLVDWTEASDQQLAVHDPLLLIMLTRWLVAGREVGDTVCALLSDDRVDDVERSVLAAGGVPASTWVRERRRMVLLAWLRHVSNAAPVNGGQRRWVRLNVTRVLERLPRSGAGGRAR